MQGFLRDKYLFRNYFVAALRRRSYHSSHLLYIRKTPPAWICVGTIPTDEPG